MPSFTSHGKIILSGEHSVVYGYPALVCPAEQSVKVEIQKNGFVELSPFLLNILDIFRERYSVTPEGLNLSIKSTIPLGSGLGSSAATALAVFQALFQFFQIEHTQEDLFDLVQQSERFAHGTPSGVDATAVVYQDLIEFRKVEGKLHWSLIKKKNSIPKFLLIQSGIPVESTKEMVMYVQQSDHKEEILAEIGKVTQEMGRQLKNGLFEVRFISRNERLLEKLGVVSDKAKQIIREIELVGGFAKIVGAGGRKDGAGVIIVFHTDLGMIKSLAKKSRWEILS